MTKLSELERAAVMRGAMAMGADTVNLFVLYLRSAVTATPPEHVGLDLVESFADHALALYGLWKRSPR